MRFSLDVSLALFKSSGFKFRRQSTKCVSLNRIVNQIFVIAPYKRAGTWVFDDPSVGLEAEPFVAGVPEMIDRLVAPIENASDGFRCLFSSSPFPGAQVELERKHEEIGGWWYFSPDFNATGWLCPALFKYFDAAPEKLFVKAEPLTT